MENLRVAVRVSTSSTSSTSSTFSKTTSTSRSSSTSSSAAKHADAPLTADSTKARVDRVWASRADLPAKPSMAFALFKTSASASAPPTAANARTSVGRAGRTTEPSARIARFTAKRSACAGCALDGDDAASAKDAPARAPGLCDAEETGLASDGSEVPFPAGVPPFKGEKSLDVFLFSLDVFSNPAHVADASRRRRSSREPQSRTWKEDTEGRVSERWSWGAVTGQFADLDSRLGSRDPIVATRAY